MLKPQSKSLTFPHQILARSGQDSARIRNFFPEETASSRKMRVATKWQDPDRIQNKIFKDPDKFIIVFETGLSQGTSDS